MNSSHKRIPCIVLFAPTAAGKTALALKLFGTGSRSFFKRHAELISADSMQVYTGMDIGTAKPSHEEQHELPHYLIDLYPPDAQYSAADFITRADDCCRQIAERGNVPLVAGGTGFYIRSFLFGLPPTPPSDEQVRRSLTERAVREGTEALYEELTDCDPASAAVISPNDGYRICRALEVYMITGKPRSSFLRPEQFRSSYNFCILELVPPRDELYRRIDARVDDMMVAGLASEVNGLRAAGYGPDDPGMQAIGYREWFAGLSTAETAEKIKADSRHYAKKQYTYLRNIPGAVQIPYDGSESAVEQVRKKIVSFFNDLYLT